MSRAYTWNDVNIHMLRDEELAEKVDDLRGLAVAARQRYAAALSEVKASQEALDDTTAKLRAHEGNLARRAGVAP